MKIIEIDITKKDDLYEKYNKKIVSEDFIEYLIEKAKKTKRDEKIKIVINNKTKEENLSKLIKEGFESEYATSKRFYHKNNKTQLNYLLLGASILFVSTQIKGEFFKEMLLIGGWVFIWSMIEIELFTDVRGRKKRRILKKLLNSEIIEK